jgi:hypothetical protein
MRPSKIRVIPEAPAYDAEAIPHRARHAGRFLIRLQPGEGAYPNPCTAIELFGLPIPVRYCIRMFSPFEDSASSAILDLGVLPVGSDT